ncbi:MFS transporter [Vibrio chagasii]|nr:MFS transporter [Vibrio chagasii]
MYWKEAGHSEAIIGYLWSLAVVAEVAVFALSKRLFAGLSLRTLFCDCWHRSNGSLGYYGINDAIPVLIVAQLLHELTFAMAHIAAIQYIQSQESNKMVALQALARNAIPLGAFIALMTTPKWLGLRIVGREYLLWGLRWVPLLFIKQ